MMYSPSVYPPEPPRGGTLSETEHVVKTIACAKKWWPDADESSLPLTIHQATTSDGRTRVSVYDRQGKLRYSRG